MALDLIIVIALSIVASVALAACVTLVFFMRRTNRKPKIQPENKDRELNSLLGTSSPFRISKSVQSTDAVHAKDELRILELEREILGDAIRHLYEAHAEGKINEQERERLASSYKQRMMTVKESMAKDETIVALHELEGMQEDLMKMFSERFGELTGKVEELRSRIDVRPVKEIKVQIPKAEPTMPDQMEKEDESAEEEGEGKVQKKTRKPPTERKTQKSEAEQRIDAIRNQIDEVMNKLGQIEVDA